MTFNSLRVSTKANPQVAAILVAILVIIHLIKPILKFGLEYYESILLYEILKKSSDIND